MSSDQDRDWWIDEYEALLRITWAIPEPGNKWFDMVADQAIERYGATAFVQQMCMFSMNLLTATATAIGQDAEAFRDQIFEALHSNAAFVEDIEDAFRDIETDGDGE